MNFEHGSILICIGTPTHHPHIVIHQKGKQPDVYVIPGGDSGYQGLFIDFLNRIYGSSSSLGPDLETRYAVGIESVKFLEKAYGLASEIIPHTLGTSPEVEIPVDLHASEFALINK